MPRGAASPRMLWPDAALSRSLARCSIGAQLLFDRLISLADDQGRQEGEVEVVRGSAFPLLRKVRDVDVEKWLGELAEQRLVLRYQADEEVVIQLRGWWEWQRLEWARASRFPPPEGWSDRLGKRPSGEVRTAPDPSGPVPQNEKENQKENQKSGPGRSPDSDGRSFREKVGPIPALDAPAPGPAS